MGSLAPASASIDVFNCEVSKFKKFYILSITKGVHKNQSKEAN
jgi:hypothetical protein